MRKHSYGYFLLAGALSFLPHLAFSLDLQDLLADSTPDAADPQWYHSDWFGFFRYDGPIPAPVEGWIYHAEHAYLYIFNQANDIDYAVWDTSMNTTVWFNPGFYPELRIYSQIEGSGYAAVYDRSSAPDRVFIRAVDNVPEIYPIEPLAVPPPYRPLPLWWFSQGLVDYNSPIDHYSPTNLGQLKHVATEAKRYLESVLTLSASDWEAAFQAMGGSDPFDFSTASHPENYNLVNSGQLKFIAGAFYEVLALPGTGYDTYGRLIDVGLSASQISQAQSFPWSSDASVDNYAPINIGQLKLAFSFDLHGEFYDSDGDGIANYKDANPNEASIQSAMSVAIEYPTDGSVGIK